MPGSVLAALITVQVLFGLNYVVTKLVVDAFPPLVWASIRAIIVAVGLLSIATILRKPRPKLSREFLLPVAGFSLMAVAINQGSFLFGLKLTTATNSAVLNTTIPIFTLAIVTLRGQERMTARRALGFVLGLGGVLVMRKAEDLSLSDATLVGDLLTVLNCLSYSLFLSFGRPFMQKHDPIWVTGFLFAFGSIPLTLVALPEYSHFHIPSLSPQLLGCMTFAALGGTLLSYLLNFWALARVRSSAVALFIYLQPIVAAALAWSWMNEVPTPRTVLASIVIFSGLLLGIARAEKSSS